MSEEVKNEEKHTIKQKQRRTPNKNFREACKAVKWIAICVAVVAIVVNVKGPAGTMFSLIKDGKRPATSITIEHGLRDLSSLNTAEYYYTHAGKLDDDINIPYVNLRVPFTNKKAIYTCQGSIKAGFDFSKIEVKKFGKHLTIMLPVPEITSSEVDHNSFEVFDEKNNIFNPITLIDVNNSFADIKKDEESKAIETGLYTRAIDNAKMIIESFIRSGFDYRDWEIEFKETEPEPSPDSSDIPETTEAPDS